MQKSLGLVVAIFIFVGCGGQVAAGTNDDDTAADSAACKLGTIGGTPGLPHVLAGGNGGFFTVSTPDELSDGAQPNFGALAFLRDDGSGLTLVSNGVDESTVVPIEDNIAFMRDSVSADGDFVGTSIEMIGADGTNARVLDRTSSTVEELSSLRSDGAGGFTWLRWSSPPTTTNVSPSIGHWDSESKEVSTITLDSPVAGIESMVSNGGVYFGHELTNGVIESLPVNGAKKSVAVPSSANPDVLVAVDDQRIIYEEYYDSSVQVWSAPRSGETPTIVAYAPAGVMPVLRNHVLYGVDPSGPGATLWSYTFGVGMNKIADLDGVFVGAIAVDDCGVDVASIGSDGRSNVVTRYAFR